MRIGSPRRIANMSRGIIGAILGLIIGWVTAGFLQRLISGIGANGLLLLLVVIGGAIIGAIIAGAIGAVIGAIAGALLGGLAVGLFFTFLKLVAMVIGAILGWQLAKESENPAAI
jgi:hypothetical protein